MADIDVNHWRNLQELVLDSAKAKRRIILIHERGELLKFVHSQREEIVKTVDRVDDPLAVAEKVYRSNQGKADFVVVLERRAVEKYFANVQDTWNVHEDLDEYVHRMFSILDEYEDGIVTYPGSARSTLGLQWRLGASYESVKAAVDKFVPANSTVIFGIFQGNSLWTSLVLGFDSEKSINHITTFDPSERLLNGDWHAQARELVEWVNKKFSTCSLGFFLDRASVVQFLKTSDKLAIIRSLAKDGKLDIYPIPRQVEPLLNN
jgi:hypothetical protein